MQRAGRAEAGATRWVQAGSPGKRQPWLERSRVWGLSLDQSGFAHGLQGSDGTGDEGGLLFEDGVVDGEAEAFVEDFYAEQFGTGGGAVLVGHGAGDVEGQDLVGPPPIKRMRESGG